MKTSITHRFALAASLITGLFLNSCKEENMCDCIKRTGDIITETRDLKNFTDITVEDNLNVYITQDTVFEVKIEAGENIVPLIKAEVSDGVLKLRNDNRCNWTRSYDKPFNVYVKMPVIGYILSNGTGNITSVNTITTPTIDLETKSSGDIEFTVNNTKVTSHMFGYGDIHLHGNTVEHACSIGGDGFLYASDLQSTETWLRTYTNGLCYVRAQNKLTVIIDKDGDVYCYGNPPIINKTQNGSGNLIMQ